LYFFFLYFILFILTRKYITTRLKKEIKPLVHQKNTWTLRLKSNHFWQGSEDFSLRILYWIRGQFMNVCLLFFSFFQNEIAYMSMNVEWAHSSSSHPWAIEITSYMTRVMPRINGFCIKNMKKKLRSKSIRSFCKVIPKNVGCGCNAWPKSNIYNINNNIKLAWHKFKWVWLQYQTQ
jgi:hypothetical protein